MPVSDRTPYKSYAASGGSIYNFDFKLPDADDLVVSAGGVLQELGTDYTVTITPDPGEGGSIAFQPGRIPAVESGDVELERRLLLNRETDYQESGGFRQTVVDKDFDRIVMLVQDRERRLAKAEADIDALEVRDIEHDDRLAIVEESASEAQIRINDIETVVARFGSWTQAWTDLVIFRDATNGPDLFSLMAANDPSARVVVVIKKDASENSVTIVPDTGTICGGETFELIQERETVRLAPDPVTNDWFQI